MHEEEIKAKFEKLLKENETERRNAAIGAVRTLIYIIENYNGSTINGLMAELKDAVKILEERIIPAGKSKLAVSSACAQFIRYTTLYLGTIEMEDFSMVTKLMLEEGGKYLKRCENSVLKIAKWGTPFIFDGARVIVHSHSNVVLETLKSIPDHIFFTVYLVSNEDSLKCQVLRDKVNIDFMCISDAEVGTRMENIDLVLVGAEAVVKNGGIINKVGTLPLAICAKEMNKPMYVLAESFKFSLLYPLNQNDIPKIYREDPLTHHIRVDYTPPKYLTLLITDRGLLTPVAVCDELIEMYT